MTNERLVQESFPTILQIRGMNYHLLPIQRSHILWMVAPPTRIQAAFLDEAGRSFLADG
jgi:hypothetical protein